LAINLVTKYEMREIGNIERYYSTDIDALPENFTDFI